MCCCKNPCFNMLRQRVKCLDKIGSRCLNLKSVYKLQKYKIFSEQQDFATLYDLHFLTECTDESSGYRIRYNPSNYPGPIPVQNLTGFQNGRQVLKSLILIEVVMFVIQFQGTYRVLHPLPEICMFCDFKLFFCNLNINRGSSGVYVTCIYCGNIST